jgi:hypothetical protein
MDKKRISFKNLLLKSLKIILIILYITIIVSMIAGGVTAGIMTLIPSEGLGWTVSKANYLGYMSICSFAPFSTSLLFGMAFLGSFLLLKRVKYLRRKSKK